MNRSGQKLVCNTTQVHHLRVRRSIAERPRADHLWRAGVVDLLARNEPRGNASVLSVAVECALGCVFLHVSLSCFLVCCAWNLTFRSETVVYLRTLQAVAHQLLRPEFYKSGILRHFMTP